MASPIGRAVRTARLAVGMTQEQLAEGIGVSQPRLSAIERGESPPGLAQIRQIEQALGLTDGYLLRAAGLVAPTGEDAPSIDYVEVAHNADLLLEAVDRLLRSVGVRADARRGRPLQRRPDEDSAA